MIKFIFLGKLDGVTRRARIEAPTQGEAEIQFYALYPGVTIVEVA